jgi:hypothetical protein
VSSFPSRSICQSVGAVRAAAAARLGLVARAAHRPAGQRRHVRGQSHGHLRGAQRAVDSPSWRGSTRSPKAAALFAGPGLPRPTAALP